MLTCLETALTAIYLHYNCRHYA